MIAIGDFYKKYFNFPENPVYNYHVVHHKGNIFYFQYSENLQDWRLDRFPIYALSGEKKELDNYWKCFENHYRYMYISLCTKLGRELFEEYRE